MAFSAVFVQLISLHFSLSLICLSMHQFLALKVGFVLQEEYVFIANAIAYF
jgi:hypothetical protein